MKNLFYSSRTLITTLDIFVVEKCSNQDEFLLYQYCKIERRSKPNPKTKRYQQKKFKSLETHTVNIIIKFEAEPHKNC